MCYNNVLLWVFLSVASLCLGMNSSQPERIMKDYQLPDVQTFMFLGKRVGFERVMQHTNLVKDLAGRTLSPFEVALWLDIRMYDYIEFYRIQFCRKQSLFAIRFQLASAKKALLKTLFSDEGILEELKIVGLLRSDDVPMPKL